MHVFNGAAGAGLDGEMVEILVPPTDVGAGLKITTEKSLAADKCDILKVPSLIVGEIWRETFSANERCGILKIDIEGAELRFLQEEMDFLRLVDRLIVEVHESVVSLDDIISILKDSGFSIMKNRKEDSQTSLIFAERKKI